jgi:hypothetical protein
VIDSDHDVDCFITVPGFDQSLIACTACRDHLEGAGHLDAETNTLLTAP